MYVYMHIYLKYLSGYSSNQILSFIMQIFARAGMLPLHTQTPKLEKALAVKYMFNDGSLDWTGQ